MSYDIYLLEPVGGQIVHFDEPHDLAGGTRVLGGTTEAWLNVTYNYSDILRRVLGQKGIRGLYGRTAGETIPQLRGAIGQLAPDYSEDYWEPTEGNVKRALLSLLALAERRPDAVWDGD